MSSAANSSSQRTLTLDDIFAMEQVIDPQISPDGAQVAYVLTRGYTETPDGATKLTQSPEASIWLADATGATPARRLTFGPHSDHFPRWSPDGTTLAFLSDREQRDTHQVYLLSLTEGGEAQRLTNAKGGVTDLAWSPDGKRIAFLATDAESEDDERRKREQGGAQVLDQDYQFTRLWVCDVADLHAAPQSEARAITPPEYQVRGYAWYWDGWAVVSSPTPKEDDFCLPWTLLYVTENQPAQKLWQGTFAIAPLAGAPDGQALAWLHGGANAQETSDEVWVLQGESEPRCVLRDYSGGTAWVAWAPDGASLLLGAFDGARSLVGRLDLASGTVEPLITGRALAASFVNQGDAWVSMSRDGQRIACAPETGNAPREIWAGPTNGELQQVTAHNTHLRDVTLGRQETIRWTAPDGLEIEGVLIYPVGYEAGRRYPLVIHAHGGPNGRWPDRFLLNWHDWGQWLAAHGYAVLAPNPRGSVGYGREFTWRNRRAWGEGDFADFTSGADALIERGVADPDRMGFGGWSYGGYMTSWAIGHSNRFKAAIVGAGVTDLLSFQAADIPTWLPTEQMLATPYEDVEIYRRCSPITYVENMTTPTLIVHGAADERVRLGQGRELYHALRARKIPTEMVVYPDEPHIFGDKRRQRDLLTRVLAWFDRWLKNE